MGTEQQRFGERIVFERGYEAHMMAIAGTGRRACRVD
jgi:hypothetical protein